MSDNRPPDKPSVTLPDDEVRQCFAKAGTIPSDEFCPRCLKKEAYKHRKNNADACNNDCALCNNSTHKGKHCPLMETLYKHVLGKSWLTVHWPEHVHPRSTDEILTAKRNLELQSRGENPYGHQGGYRDRYQSGWRGGYQGRHPGGYRGSYQSGYQDRYHDNRSREDSRRRSRSPERRDDRSRQRSESQRHEVPLAQQSTIDPSVDPSQRLLQVRMKAKTEARSSAQKADTVMGDDSSIEAQLRSQLDPLQNALDLLQKQFDAQTADKYAGRQKIAELSDDLLKVNAERDTLQERLQRTMAELGQVKKDYTSEKQKLEKEALAKFSELEREAEKAMTQAGRQGIAIEDLKSDNECLKNEVQRLQAENANLTREGLHIENANLKDEVQRLQGENNNLIHEGRRLQDENANLIDEGRRLEQEIGRIQQTQARVDETNNQLEAASSAPNPQAPAGTIFSTSTGENDDNLMDDAFRDDASVSVQQHAETNEATSAQVGGGFDDDELLRNEEAELDEDEGEEREEGVVHESAQSTEDSLPSASFAFQKLTRF